MIGTYAGSTKKHWSKQAMRPYPRRQTGMVVATRQMARDWFVGTFAGSTGSRWTKRRMVQQKPFNHYGSVTHVLGQ